MDSSKNYADKASLFASAVAKEIEAKAAGRAADIPSYADMFTDRELLAINEYSKKLNITDNRAVSSFGGGVLKKLDSFADTISEIAKTSAPSDTVGMLSSLAEELKSMSEDSGDKASVLELFRTAKSKLNRARQKYEQAKASVGAASELLRKNRAFLKKESSDLKQLHGIALDYLRELTMYIAAGKLKSERETGVTLPQIVEYAKKSGKAEDAQAIKTYWSLCQALDDRLAELEQTRESAVQALAQIKILTDADVSVITVTDTALSDSVPSWNREMEMYLGLESSDLTASGETPDIEELFGTPSNAPAVNGAPDTYSAAIVTEELTMVIEDMIYLWNEASAASSEAKAKLTSIASRMHGSHPEH